MKIIRWILRWFILFGDYLFRPSFKQHTASKRAILEQKTSGFILYEFVACPFCVKVRWAMRRLGLNIQIRDAKNQLEYKKILLQKGGKVQVPCLYIPEGDKGLWLYESAKIIEYLEENFSEKSPLK